MTRNTFRITALLAAVSLGALTTAAGALDIDAGSSDSGGTSASVSEGDTSVDIGIGGENTADVEAGSGDADAGIAVTDEEGDVIELDQDDSSADAMVNLGDLLGDTFPALPGDDAAGGGSAGGGSAGGGAGGATPEQIGDAFASLSSGEQQLLRNRCLSVLASPDSFEAGVINLCRTIARL